jgi:hypothetical protein
MVIGDNPIQLRVTDSAAKTATTAGVVRLAAPVAGQLGILDLDANGGINPNTGEPWQVGDRYRLAFHTLGKTTSESNDPNFYNDFVTSEAWTVPALQSAYWRAMVTINLDPNVVEADSPKWTVQENTGTGDLTDGAGVGGAGEPVYVMNGTTCIARNNADIWNSWSNPFDGDNTNRVGSVYYSPYLNQNGEQTETPDANHGVTCATGCSNTGGTVRPLGNTLGGESDLNWGSSNANTPGRIWNRFGGDTGNEYSLYAISVPLTVVDLAETVNPTLTSIGDSQGGADAVLGVDTLTYTVTFDEPIDASTVTVADFGTTGTATATIDAVRGSLDPAALEVTVTPTSTGTIQLQVNAGAVVEDLVGNPLDTTSAILDDTTITVVTDTDPPTIATVSPDGTTGEPLLPTLVITFDEVSEIVIGTGNIEIRDTSDDTVLQTIDVTGPDVTLTGPLEATIEVSSALPFGTSVYVSIPSGAFEDISGNLFAGISDTSTWSFTTVALPTPDGPMSIFTAGTAGEAVPFETDPLPLTHTFDTFPRLSADHVPANASDMQLSAGHHLVLYNARFDSTGGSSRSEIQSNLSLGGAPLATGWSQGYIRRADTQDETITAGGAIIEAGAGGQLLQLQSFRTDDNSGDTAIRADGDTAIQLLKLDDSWDYLRLAGHDGGGTDQVLPADDSTWSPVEYNQELEKDAGSFDYAIGTGVTLKQSGHYLVFANTYADGASERSALIQRLTLDGAEIPGSKTNVYFRGAGQNSCEEGSATIGVIIETTGTNQVLGVEVRQSDNDGTLTVVGPNTALTMVKLPDTADFVRLIDDSGDQDVNAVGQLAFDDAGSQLEVDTAFSHDTGTDPSRVGAGTAGDYLFFSSFFIADDGTARAFPNLGWQVNGTGGLADHGQTGRYSRDLGPQEAGNWGGFMTGLSAADYVETLTEPLGNTGSNIASVLALQGVSVDSLFDSTPPPASPYNDWAGGFAGLSDPGPSLDFDGGGLDTGIEWVVGGDPTDPNDDAGLAPTIDNTTDPDFFIFTYRRTDEAAADANTDIAVEYGSDLVGWTDAVAGADVEIDVTDDGAGVGIDLVNVKIRRTLAVDGKLFIRLNAEITSP